MEPIEKLLQNISNRLDSIENRINRLENKSSATQEVSSQPREQNSGLSYFDRRQEVPQDNQKTVSPAPEVSSAPSVPQAPRTEEVVSNPKTVDGEARVGRWIGKIGIVAILAGFVFFLKYTFDNNIITEFGRMILGFVSGALFVAAGFVMPKKYSVYRDTLAGGGVLLWYIITYVGNVTYGFISDGLAFFLYLVAILVATWLSLIKTKHFAYLALAGGYLMPIFLGLTTLHPYLLLAYIGLLLGGMTTLAVYKEWKDVAVIAFFGTGILTTAFISAVYDYTHFTATLVALTVYFLVIVGSSAFTSKHSKEKKDDELTGIILLLAGIWYVATGYSILEGFYGEFLGIFAFFASCVYFALALYTRSEVGEARKNTPLISSVIGSGLLMVALFYQFEGPILTLLWLLQAGGMYVISFKYWHKELRVISAGVLVIALTRLLAVEVLTVGVFGWSSILYLIALAMTFGVAYYYWKVFQDNQEDTLLDLGHKVFLSIGTYVTLVFISEQVTEVPEFWLYMLFAVILGVIGFVYKHAFLKILAGIVYIVGLLHVFFEFSFDGAWIIFNTTFTAYFALIALALIGAAQYYRVAQQEGKESLCSSLWFILGIVLCLVAITGETGNYFDQKIERIDRTSIDYLYENNSPELYKSEQAQEIQNVYYDQVQEVRQQEELALSIFYTLFALIVTLVGFAQGIRKVRLTGIILFFFAALYIFFFIWSLGSLYRIVGSIIFGVLALVLSFVYAKYREKIQEVIE